jgi:hypothetical protein
MGLFMVRVLRKKKKDLKTFVGLLFANNIYLKQNYVRKIE